MAIVSVCDVFSRYLFVEHRFCVASRTFKISESKIEFGLYVNTAHDNKMRNYLLLQIHLVARIIYLNVSEL